MGLKIGVVGTWFARSFIPLFQAHPLVEEVVLAERIPERLRDTAAEFGIRRTCNSLTELCATDVDAIAIYTQRHLHGPHALEALRAGKNVYCAVPLASSLEEVAAIVREVEERRLIYMTGETSYYYPNTLYCRQRWQEGAFGRFVYGEAAYYHDLSHGFYEAFQRTGGEQWRQVAGFPPMYYPTHSVSMIVSVTGARCTHVSCLGYRDQHEDGVFRKGANLWDNEFSNQTGLMRTSDGGMCRINEFRRVGWGGTGNGVHLSIFGTQGSYEEQANAQVWVGLKPEDTEDLSALLDCKPLPVEVPEEGMNEVLQRDFYTSISTVHPVARLPRSFAGLPNGHFGSHQFLVDDFVKSVASHRLPPNHVWNAARYCAPGLVAHDSSLQEGRMLAIPDFGDPPADWGLTALDSPAA